LQIIPAQLFIEDEVVLKTDVVGEVAHLAVEVAVLEFVLKFKQVHLIFP
jgi:hypothetical protein